jgi:hypothetical protein
MSAKEETMSDFLDVGRVVAGPDGSSVIQLRRDFYDVLMGVMSGQLIPDVQDGGDTDDGEFTVEMIAPFMTQALLDAGFEHDDEFAALFADVCLGDEQLHSEMSPTRFEEIVTYCMQRVNKDNTLEAPEGSGAAILDSLAAQGFLDLL